MFIGVKDDCTINAFADNAVKRRLQFRQKLNADVRFSVDNAGKLDDTVVGCVRGVIHSESPNGRFYDTALKKRMMSELGKIVSRPRPVAKEPRCTGGPSEKPCCVPRTTS